MKTSHLTANRTRILKNKLICLGEASKADREIASTGQNRRELRPKMVFFAPFRNDKMSGG
jgi:hypothetical protein